jgi:hypothetical protein
LAQQKNQQALPSTDFPCLSDNLDGLLAAAFAAVQSAGCYCSHHGGTPHNGLRTLAKNLEGDVRTLAADVLAVRMVLAHVLGRIYQLDPILAEAIQGGFEDAVDQIRKTAAKSRKRLPPDQTVEALAAVKTLQSAISNRGRSSVANDNM